MQFIGAQLVDQPDAPPLLPHVEQNAPSFPLDLCHGGGKLLPAVTAQRTKGISCQTLRMHAAQDLLAIANLSFDQGDMMLSIEPVHKTVCPEITIFCGHLDNCLTVYQLLMTFAVVLQIPYCDKGHIPLSCKRRQFRRAHHRSILAHNLTA